MQEKRRLYANSNVNSLEEYINKYGLRSSQPGHCH